MTTTKVSIMQKNGPRYEPWFHLQDAQDWEDCQDLLYRFMKRREARGEEWPKWSVNGKVY